MRPPPEGASSTQDAYPFPTDGWERSRRFEVNLGKTKAPKHFGVQQSLVQGGPACAYVLQPFRLGFARPRRSCARSVGIAHPMREASGPPHAALRSRRMANRAGEAPIRSGMAERLQPNRI